MTIIYVAFIYAIAVLTMHNIINTGVIGGYWLTLIASVLGLGMGFISLIAINKLNQRKPIGSFQNSAHLKYPLYFVLTAFISFVLFSSLNSLFSLSAPKAENFSVVRVYEKRIRYSNEKFAEISNGSTSINHLLGTSDQGLAPGDTVYVKVQRGLLGFNRVVEVRKSNKSFKADAVPARP
jgi:hypothetical protein